VILKWRGFFCSGRRTQSPKDSEKVILLPLVNQLKMKYSFLKKFNIESNMAFMQKPRNLVNAFNFGVTCVLYCCCYLEMLIVPFRILFGLICSGGQYLCGR